MDNPEKLATLGTQDMGRGQAKQKHKNDNGSFTFYVDFLFSLPRFLPDLTVYMSNTTGVL
jgi:hypothetical protein